VPTLAAAPGILSPQPQRAGLGYEASQLRDVDLGPTPSPMLGFDEEDYVRVEHEMHQGHVNVTVKKAGWLSKQSFYVVDGRYTWKRHFERWTKVSAEARHRMGHTSHARLALFLFDVW
jgi:hypothetical protein